MNDDKPRKIVQATPFQRFTIRLVDGHFVRIPKPDLPVVHGVDQSATSNQTELRDLFRMVHGRFERVGREDAPPGPGLAAKPPPAPVAPPVHDIPAYPDPTFDLPDEHRLPGTR